MVLFLRYGAFTMFTTKIAVVSSPSLEKWDWRNLEIGIGGSETSHVKMAQLLHLRGRNVVSFSPMPEDRVDDPSGLKWMDSGEFTAASFDVVINYRDPALFNPEVNLKPPGAKWWFIAQDVGYPWKPEELAQVDRYICLCPTHAQWTAKQYPELHSSGRLFVSSNGINSNAIKAAIEGVERNPLRLMYASSPDRGLELILENWFRIREKVPMSELHVFYGFQNMEKIIEMAGDQDWRAPFMRKIKGLLDQPGVVWHDRVGQTELWREWAKTNIFFHPTDFPETSMITCMEAQACGAWPVVNNFWAPMWNVLAGVKFDGVPQENRVVKALMVEKVISLLRNSTDLDGPETEYVDDEWDDYPTAREHMQVEARWKFNWRNVAIQWDEWIRRDSGENNDTNKDNRNSWPDVGRLDVQQFHGFPGGSDAVLSGDDMQAGGDDSVRPRDGVVAPDGKESVGDPDEGGLAFTTGYGSCLWPGPSLPPPFFTGQTQSACYIGNLPV